MTSVLFTWAVVACTVIGLCIGPGRASAQRDEMPAGYPQSLEAELQGLLRRVREGPVSPGLLVQVSSTYFDIADDLLTDKAKRREAYEAGAAAAQQAIELDESNADAHFFHAANLGSAEQLRGPANAAFVVKEVLRCAQRAIELNPAHAPALQMMGGLSIELPWFLGGDETKAQQYLERAVAADGNYTKAHLLLAKLYRNQGRLEDARRHLNAVIRADHPHYRFAWERQYKPQAERLLKEMEDSAAR
jgi:tetratricopeptide (TPR) repeat protein